MSKHDTKAPTGGWDWATDTHAVSVVDADGTEAKRFELPNTAADLRRVCRRLLAAGVRCVAIERPDGPAVDALWAAGLDVFVIAPRQVKALRGRYGSTGNKDDRFDAFVLADTLRTDAARLRPLMPDTPATVTLRATCRARKDLVEARISLCNQLRAHLRVTFPGAVGLFADLDSPISLRFLTRFPSAGAAAWLSQTRLAAWLRGAGYSGRTPAAVLYGRLADAPVGLVGADGDARAHVTVAYVAALHGIRARITDLDRQITEQLALHPDAAIVQSFPRSGTIRAATFLAELGDCRARFPTPQSLACLAGVAPSTRQSGKLTAITFRFACDKKLRDALLDFVGDSRLANPWAADIYNRAIARNKTHPQAERILARAWTYVIWRCWQNSTPYNPERHRALQHLLNPDKSDAA
jgi:transposase